MSAIVKKETVTEQVIDGIVIQSTAQVLAEQDVIRADLKTLDARVHANAVQCLIHASIHRDTSLMRRLLVDTIPENGHGYRRQGLIAWMKMFSPMELGKTNGQYVIKLSGVDKDGQELPFQIDKANMTKFWNLTTEIAMLKPQYRDSLFSRITGAANQFRNALENTDEFGKPKDPKKAFYSGLHRQEMQEFFDMIDAQTVAFVEKFPDDTLEVEKFKENMRKTLGSEFEIVKKAA
jgi:hypothetical protein